MTRPIPQGYQSVTPMCVFKDARKALDFYQRAFGAVERMVMPNPGGKGIMHAELQIGSSILMLSEEQPQQPCKSAETLGTSPVSFYLYRDDVDTALCLAVDAGATVLMPAAEMFWGDRIATVLDPFGYSWTLATRTRELSKEEIAKGAEAFFNAMAQEDLVITRSFAAPRERLWQAWTEPQQMMRWWGPQNFTTPVCKLDLRVGGRYLSCMRSPEGQDFWSTGTYREIDAPRRLVCTDSFADAAGNIVPAAQYGMTGEWPLELLVTMTLEESAGGTTLTLRHAGLPAGEMKEQCAAGWNESFDKLAKIVETTG